MIPRPISNYLQEQHIHFTPRSHPRAVGSQRFAQAVHTAGKRVAKSVIVDVDGRTWIAVLPATSRLDARKLASGLQARQVSLLPEEKLGECFPGCELGAEPPFGKLYHLPVVVDSSLASQTSVVVPGGSHEDALEFRFEDFERAENPTVCEFALA